MIIFSGYSLEKKISENKRAMIFRGFREEDNQPVIIKLLNKEYPSPSDEERFTREYDIIGKFNSEGIIKARKLVRHQHTLFMILEDFDGIPVNNLIRNIRLNLKDLLLLSIHITTILDQIHQRNIIHKDIQPSHFLWDLKTARVKLVDFGISVESLQDNQNEINPNLMEGTFQYMSPEQTGRVNRGIDYRTDFYSLGVTLYEIFMNRLPFDSDDPMVLVHSHIAHTPQPPFAVNRNMPPILSDIIMKLMAKAPEDRYQTAFGIRYDLEKCYEQLIAGGTIKPFTLGEEDISDKFQIPQKLYGRKTEVQALLDVFDRIREGKMEIMLVAGYSGIGKTALVKELQRPVIEKRGFFIQGKFDQYQRDIPYTAISQAFDEFIAYVLAETEAVFRDWKEKILSAVGEMGKVLTDMIPSLELVIGRQPEVPQIDGEEAQNRFNYIFQKLIHVMSTKEHPLVLFVDDLQWIDAASLNLLRVLATNVEQSAILVIGAYRNNEVDPTHPLMLALEDIKKQGVTVQTLSLQNLSGNHLNDLLKETLNTPKAPDRLSALLWEKTHGNPFFLKRLLYTLNEGGQIAFNPVKRRWEWDVDAIVALNITDNVADLLSAKIKKLPSETQDILKFAACIGNRFELSTLSAITNLSEENIEKALEKALVGQFVTHKKHLYYFVHDRIQEAAYALIEPDKRNSTHLQIGRLLSADSRAEDMGEQIFDVVNQFNKGIDLVDSKSEILRIAEMNLMAGKKAKKATAYQSALIYLTTGTDLLPDDEWNHHYSLMFDLHKERYECEYLTAQFEKAEKSFALILDNAGSNRDRSEIYNICIVQYTTMAQHEKAIEAGRKALKLYDIDLPENDLEIAAATELSKIQKALNKKKIADLIHLPEMIDSEKKEVFRLLMNLRSPAYLSNSGLFRFIMGRIINISLKYGNTEDTPYGYAAYGAIPGPGVGDYKSGHEFGELGIKIGEKLGNNAQKCRALHMFAVFVNHWRMPMRSNLSYARQVYQKGLESGELLFAGFSFVGLLNVLISMGETLQNILEQVEIAENFARKTKNHVVLSVSVGWRQFVLNICGKTVGTSDFPNQEFNESEYLTKARNNPISVAYYKIRKLQYLYIYEKYTEALTTAEDTEDTIAFVSGTLAEADYNFYYSLTLCRLYTSADEKGKVNYRDKLKIHQNQMKIWADNCADNFLHKYLLVEAEIARFEGRNWEASLLYRDAIQDAHNNDFIQIEALANELTGRFYAAQGFFEIAEMHFKKAYYAYTRWGAAGRAKKLKKKHLRTISVTAKGDKSGRLSLGASPPSSEEGSEILDLAAVMKASQAISKEIEIEQLLKNLMKIVIQNAGAQRGVLVLNKNGKLVTVAEGSADRGEIILLDSVYISSEDTSEKSILPATLVYYVARKKEYVVLDDASNESRYSDDPYVVKNQPRSVLCTPIMQHGKLAGILYLENNLSASAFSGDRVEMLNFLCSQMAISIENARLYSSLKVSEERYRSIFDNAFEGIFQVTPGGKIFRANSSFAQILGYESPESLLSKFTDSEKLYHLFKDPDNILSRVISQKEEVSGLEAPMQKKDGTKIWVSVSARPICDHEGQVLYWEGSLLDINERKEKEKAEKQKEAAEIAAKTKSKFLAKMSHEIRTPMNAIVGLTNLALRTDLSSRQRDYLNKIESSAHSLLGIINNILDFSKIEADKLEMELTDFNMEKVLSNLSDLISIKAEEKGLELVFGIENDVPSHLIGDPFRLGQVLTNLCSNAVKFTKKGQVVVKVEKVDPYRQDSKKHIMLRFVVKDTGIGIKQEQISSLFKPFQQADNSITRKYGGTGLGLAISKPLVEMMGGDISVTSEYAKGSTFAFTARFGIGKKRQKKHHIRPDELKDENIVSFHEIKAARILLVEDHEINQQIVAELLHNAGVDVTVAPNGLKAVEMLHRKDLENSFDAILMDLQMPEMDGYEATRQIREEFKRRDLPIIALTAHAISGELEKCLEAGMNDYVVKPIDPEILFSTLIKWIPPLSRKILNSPEKKPHEAADQVLPDTLAGFDLEAALIRLAGNKKFYKELLCKFAQKHHDLAGKIQKALKVNDLEKAKQLLHMVKGMSGNLGAKGLHQASIDLEATIKGDVAEQTDQRLEIFIDVFSQTLDAINGLDTGNKGNTDDSSIRTEPLLDIEKIKPLLIEFQELIESDYVEAMNRISNLKDLLSTTRVKDDMCQLENYIEEFNKEKAIKCLKNMAHRLNIEL